MSRVTAIISALVICIIVCLSWAVNHYRDNAITYKAQRDKNARELEVMNAAITDMQMRQRDVAALDAKYTKELADAKAENDALRDDVAAGRRRLHIKAACQPVKPPPPPAWIRSSPTGSIPNGDYFTLREADYKNNWKEPRSILMSSADRARLTRWQTHAIIVSNTHALPAEYKCLKYKKTEQSIYECLLGFVLTTFSAPPQILLHRQFSSAQFQKRRNDG